MRRNYSTRPRMKGHGVALLMSRDMTMLIALYLIGTLALVLCFATLYTWTRNVVDEAGAPQSFWPCLYFSVTTQATVGYSGLTPAGSLARWTMGLHAILATVYNVLFLGVIVVKALWPPESIVVSPIAVFDPVEQKFRFRFYNAHRLPLCDTKYTVSLRGIGSSGDQLLYRNYRIAIQYPGHPVIESVKPWLVNTKPCSGTDAAREKLDAAKDNILCPGHLKENSYLTLQIEGKYPGLGGQICLKITRIHVKNIRCGRLALVETIDTSGDVQVQNWENFDKYTPVEMSTCSACERHKQCFLSKRIIGD